MTIYKHELKMNLKTFFIWLICIGGLCFGCILMYGSVEGSLDQMGDIFANMGMMSTIFGMDRLSLNTMTGYYATEVAMIHSLGGAMYAAILGSNLLSKEEYGHTSEFLYVFPISRNKIISQKYVSLVSIVSAFQIICTVFYIIGFRIMGENVDNKKMFVLFASQFLLFLEIATICFVISALSKRNNMGIGIGIALLLFAVDMMCRIVPAIKNLKYITPFYYCNATDIFTNQICEAGYYIGHSLITIVLCISVYVIYSKKDISA